MKQASSREKAIFLRVMEKQTAEERSALLDAECGDDIALRQRVEELLVSSDEAGGFLDGAAIEGVSGVESGDLYEQVGLLAEGPGTIIGPYKLMEQIGEGGFGLVFVAEQHEPVRRRVALKLIKPGMDTKDVVSRFEAERHALALMDHPNIARVLDAGITDSGRPYFVMELVRGIRITEFCDQSQLSPSDRLELFVSVCRAIQHAHQKGIIHRDVKPSNVLVTLHDGEPVVKVIDFGVAKALNQQLTQKTVYTKFSQMIGTPLYMSPEQAEMSGLDVDTRSDIYSLGVLLYELLTGSTPFNRERLSKAAFDEIRRIIREEEPPKPSTRLSRSGDRLPSLAAQRKLEPDKLSKVVRGELDWIVMKALEKDRNRRYETANGFAADILRYLSDDTVMACPPTAGYRLRKFVRRNKTLIATTSIVALALIAGTVTSVWQARRALRAESRSKVAAEKARENAEQATVEKSRAQASEIELIASQGELRERIYAADMNLVGQAFADRTIDRMNDLLENHRPPRAEEGPQGAEPDQRGIEWFHWWRAGHLERGQARHPKFGAFGKVAISPDGQTIALGGSGRHTFLYDSETLCLLRSPIRIGGENIPMVFSPDGRFLVVGGEWKSNGPKVLATKSWEVVATLDSDFETRVAFAEKKQLAAVGGYDRLDLWTWTDDSLWELQDRWRPQGKVEELAMTPDGNILITRVTFDFDGNTRIDVWDVPARKLVRSINNGKKFDAIALSPDGSMLAVAERDGDIGLWESESFVDSDQPSANGTLSTLARIKSLAFSTDAKRLVAGTENGNLVVCDIQENDVNLPIRVDSHSVGDIGFGNDSNTVYSAGKSGYLKVWDLSRGQPYDSIPGVDPDSQVGYTNDNTLIFNNQDGIIQRWDVRAGEPNTPLDKQTKYYRIALSDNGKFLAGVTHDDELRVWNVASRSVATTSISAESDCRLVVSRNGRRVAYTKKGRQIQDTGLFGHTTIIHFEDEIRRTNSNDSRFLNRLAHRSQAFSPDSNRLVIQRLGFSRYHSHLLDITTDPIEQRYQLPGWGPEACAAFSHDGSMLAIGSWNFDVRIHEAESGELKHVLKGHTGQPLALAFTTDGSRLISAGADATVRIWAIKENECRLLSTLRGHSRKVEFVAVSPEGTSIASVGADGKLLVWQTAPPHEVDQYVEWRLGPDVTANELNTARQISPDNLKVLERSGQRHLAIGDWNAAIENFDRALELAKDNQYSLQMRAEARAQAGQLRESLDDLNRLVQLTDGANIEYLSRRGECHLLLGSSEDAYDDFLRALVLGANPHGPVTPFFQGIHSSLLLAETIVPNGAAWRYSTTRPPNGWDLPTGDDSSWTVGAAPFGTHMSARTPWYESADIWLRKTFEFDREIEAPLILRMHVDDHAEVYLNGVLAGSVYGKTAGYQAVDCSPKARLRRGKNTIAVHCLDEGWEAASIDVGLYVRGDPTAYDKLLEAAMEQEPQILRAWCQQLIEQRRWEEAAPAFGRLVELNPTDALIRMQAAILYAYNNDLARFHQLSIESLHQFAETDAPDIVDQIAKACLVAPPHEVNLHDASALVEKSLEPDPSADRLFGPWRNFPRAQLTKALCEYRRGNAKAAIEWANKCNTNLVLADYKSLSFGVLAMAHAQLRNPDAASKAEIELTTDSKELATSHHQRA